jgi:hypothetical protein
MGVSITEGNSGGSLDMDLVLKGGQAFLDRLQQLKDAKDGAEQARQNLGIAQNVVALRDEAARLVDQAKAEADGIKDEALSKAAQAQKAANEWLGQTKDAAAADRLAAAQLKADAEALHKAASENHVASVAALNEANDKLTKAAAAHEAVLAASAALSKAVG